MTPRPPSDTATSAGPTRATADDAALVDTLRALVRSALGAEIAASERILGGLGTRRLLRLTLDPPQPATLVARIESATPAPGGEPPLEPLRTQLEEAGLPVPRRFGGDPARGVDLLEDLGTLSLEAALASATPAERAALYAEACELVVRFQGVTDPGGTLPAFRRRLDAPTIAAKAELFARFSLPHGLGRPPRPDEADIVRAAFARVAEEVSHAPARLAHRDLQSSNVLVRAALPPGARLALVDFQGAWLAPPEYDLVCLLRDSYVTLPEDEVQACLAGVRPRLPDAPSPETFARRFDLLTLTRKGKDHARFLEAAARGDRRRLRHLAPTLATLRRAAARSAGLDPRLARLAELLERMAPEGGPCAR